MRSRNLTVKYCEFLDRKGVGFNFIIGAACAALLGMVDYYSDKYFGVDYTLALFYLLPVSFVAWFAGRNAAIAMALVCVATKLAMQLLTQEALALVIWKNGSSFVFYLVVGLLLVKMRQLLDHERSLSRTDHLTGAMNRRAFLDAMTREVFRLRRYGYPFAVAYIDLDNFKEVNDAHDHGTGDFLLQTVASTIVQNLRRTDVLARLGGDEFAILFANVDEKAAVAAMHKIREELHDGMRRHQLAVTFSIGVLTCTDAPQTVDEVIALADQLMYEVKRSGKDGIRSAVYARSAAPVGLRSLTGGRG